MMEPEEIENPIPTVGDWRKVRDEEKLTKLRDLTEKFIQEQTKKGLVDPRLPKAVRRIHELEIRVQKLEEENEDLRAQLGITREEDENEFPR